MGGNYTAMDLGIGSPGVVLSMARLLIWLTLVFFACVPLRSPIKVRTPLPKSRWSAQHFPIQVGISNNVHVCRAQTVYQAVQRWNDVVKLAGGRRMVFQVQRVTDFDLSKTGWIWVQEGQLSTAPDIVLGICKLGYWTGTPEIWGSVITLSRDHCNIRATAHELGHALGIRHAPCKDCTMYRSIPMVNGELSEEGLFRREDTQRVLSQFSKP